MDSKKFKVNLDEIYEFHNDLDSGVLLQNQEDPCIIYRCFLY